MELFFLGVIIGEIVGMAIVWYGRKLGKSPDIPNDPYRYLRNWRDR